MGSVLRGLRGNRHGRVHAHRLVVEDAGDVGRRAGGRCCVAEGQIGWLPYILERVDDVWREHRAWGGVKDIVPEPPSTYFHRQVYGCFFRDQHGLDSLDVIGADRVTFETDYPHTDSTWPDTRAVAEELVRNLSDEEVYRIMRGNAIAMLGLEGP